MLRADGLAPEYGLLVPEREVMEFRRGKTQRYLWKMTVLFIGTNGSLPRYEGHIRGLIVEKGMRECCFSLMSRGIMLI
jgi:hypothetical protein